MMLSGNVKRLGRQGPVAVACALCACALSAGARSEGARAANGRARAANGRALSATASQGAAAQPRSGTGAGQPTKGRLGQRDATLLRSRDLWTTVDVCNPKDQPNTVGIRGSMPSDGHGQDTMYMRFRVQYLDAATSTWAYIGKGADSNFLKVGSGAATRQAGRSFQFARASGAPPFTLRGIVVFQWRHGAKVLLTAMRPTTAPHRSLAGADPAGFSAATCELA